MRKILVICAAALLYFTGCTTVTETIYLQDIKVSGPVNHPPLHITNGQKKSSFTISPRFSINSLKSFSGQLDGHTPVNERGEYQVEKITHNDGSVEYKASGTNRFPYNGRNLNWDISDAAFGVDVDLSLSDHVALFGGLNYVVQNQKDLFGGSAGLGFFSQKDNSAIRYDVGITWQSMFYDASTVVETTVQPYNDPAYTYITFYRDRDKSSSINFFSSLTYNTAFTDFPLNFFVSASYFGQTLFDFEPSQPDAGYYFLGINKRTIDERGKASAAFISFSPGIYQNIGDMGRISLGVRMLKETQFDNLSDSFTMLPLLQVDLSF